MQPQTQLNTVGSPLVVVQVTVLVWLPFQPTGALMVRALAIVATALSEELGTIARQQHRIARQSKCSNRMRRVQIIVWKGECLKGPVVVWREEEVLELLHKGVGFSTAVILRHPTSLSIQSISIISHAPFY